MIKKIKKTLSNRRGDIVGIIIISPFVLYLILYPILSGAYLLRINDMETIANLKMDRALVYGGFTNELKDQLILELEKNGFSGSELEIEITPSEAGDSDDNTYVTRGSEIELKILYKKPHWFYYVARFGSPLNPPKPSDFYIGVRKIGMSEKW